MSDYAHYLIAVCAAPCPQCSNIVQFGELLAVTPSRTRPHYYRGAYLLCFSCGWEKQRLVKDIDESVPYTPMYPGFFDTDGAVIGWSVDGNYINGCEGPVREHGWNENHQ